MLGGISVNASPGSSMYREISKCVIEVIPDPVLSTNWFYFFKASFLPIGGFSRLNLGPPPISAKADAQFIMHQVFLIFPFLTT